MFVRCLELPGGQIWTDARSPLAAKRSRSQPALPVEEGQVAALESSCLVSNVEGTRGSAPATQGPL